MQTNVTIGADPEFFLKRGKSFVSAHDLVPGTKAEPHRLPDGSHIQADGTAVEFNIEPCVNGKEFYERVTSALHEIRLLIPKEYEFVFTPFVIYDKAYFEKIPKEARELGCDPDWLITEFPKFAANVIPDPQNCRTGSGHIHIGWTEKEETVPESYHFKDCLVAVNTLETAYQPWLQRDLRYGFREMFYGRPRSFRCKPYGVEYRSPSNHWLNFSKADMIKMADEMRTSIVKLME